MQDEARDEARPKAGPTRRRLLSGVAASAVLRALLPAAAMLGVPHSGRALGLSPQLRGAPLRVGAVLPLTGGMASFGAQARLGLDIAVREINSAGGVLGRPLEVLLHDDKSDPAQAEHEAQELARRADVLAVCGPISSGCRDAMLPVLERERLPLLYATNYEGGACSPYLFAFHTVPNQDVGRLVPYLAQNVGTHFYLLGADYVWPRNMFLVARKVIQLARGDVRGEEYVPFGTSDYSATIARVRDSGASVLLFAIPGADGIAFIRQAHRELLLERVTVGFLGFTETYLPAFGQGVGNGIYGIVPMVMSDEDSTVRNFVERARQIAGADAIVSGYVLTHYNALLALALALIRRQDISREAVVDGLEGLEFLSPTGPVMLDARDHHATMNLFLARTEQGNLQFVQALGRVKPAPQCG